ncbi:MAG: glycine cleavage system protein GcvH [candidate division KSB1 bacterium]|nr:glycine cleavage system protein GcvH [candidate division KSB1 bacterium]MDZ7272483.1 glycine cleavage system protein GcvH [candidate division KSB1 bacterium]MDZ7284493.1 glycine cleavage system protein GcvH [candidate division KSB1 bacterium]MDZ7297111.1 glycine cleavage system protein GcvH [candidate division KSB1 bacterium]MDZ7306559.1 glycine cleavage system protein GcvH [candidate division KSB1 bacterium]
MHVPANLLYTKEHEWVRIEGDVATVGITDYAQGQLGDIVYAELPAVGATTTQMQPFGTVEAVKAVSDLFAPLSGTVLEVNTALAEKPELINQDCYGAGWMIKLKITNPGERQALLAPSDYEKLIA